MAHSWLLWPLGAWKFGTRPAYSASNNALNLNLLIVTREQGYLIPMYHPYIVYPLIPYMSLLKVSMYLYLAPV